MPKIIITPLSGLLDIVRIHEPSHVVTLTSPEQRIDTPDGVAHLHISIKDITDPAEDAPQPHDHHIKALLEFGRLWDASAPLVVSCRAGISHSIAAAFILVCDRLDHVRESEIAAALRKRAAHAHPDRLMIQSADATLGRDGRMIDAIEAIGPGEVIDNAPPVNFPLAFGIL
ncbi:MAG TPA: hypothetical protein VL026_14905 [Rhizomicrobium sp.]|nr:hypothetical protein [Rhizomicrobium sp.]